MTDRQPKPCPNCESTDTKLRTWLPLKGASRMCLDCRLMGPYADTDEEANDLWDALPRREEFRAELIKLAIQYTGQTWVLDSIMLVAAKYGPREGA